MVIVTAKIGSDQIEDPGRPVQRLRALGVEEVEASRRRMLARVEAGARDADRVHPEPAHAAEQRSAEHAPRSAVATTLASMRPRAAQSFSVSIVTAKSSRSRVIAEAPMKVSQTTNRPPTSSTQ